MHLWHGQNICIGAATITEALARVENSTIVSLGHWSSAAFLQCIRMPKDQLVSVPRSWPTQHPKCVELEFQTTGI